MTPTRLVLAGASLLLLSTVGCGAARQTTPVEAGTCQYVTVPPRFCGASEDEAIWREDHRDRVRLCNGCLADEECSASEGGRCVELPGQGCSYSAFVCVYPGDPCSGDGAGCEGTCRNSEGLAVCTADEEDAADGGG